MCQIFGMPMSKVSQSGGINVDGSKTLKYCSYCSQNGEFTFNVTVQQFQASPLLLKPPVALFHVR